MVVVRKRVYRILAVELDKNTAKKLDELVEETEKDYGEFIKWLIDWLYNFNQAIKKARKLNF